MPAWMDKDGDLRFGDDPDAWLRATEPDPFRIPPDAYDASYGSTPHPEYDDPPERPEPDDEDYPFDWDLDDEDDGN